MPARHTKMLKMTMLPIIVLLIIIQLLVSESVSSKSSLVHHHVPFLWGTATAAYQVEGAVHADGRGDSIWDTFSRIPNKIHNNDNGNIADDSYNQFNNDIKLMKNMGMSAYRFSISWSRILPSGNGEINYVGIAHYNKIINELIKNGIEPMVTLYHWDLPANLDTTYKGWLDERIVKDFARYVDICFQAFGDRVKFWMTINEPWTFVHLGYVLGTFAPGRCSDRSKCPEGDSATEGYIAAHNVLLAHATAVNLYRKKYQNSQKGQIGIVLNQDWTEPLTDLPDDIEAAERRNEFLLGWFGDPIVFGKYPAVMEKFVGDRLPKFTPEQSKLLKGSFDFWGLNHYTSMYVSNAVNSGNVTKNSDITAGWSADMQVVESKYDKDGTLIGPRADSPWLTVVPWGFYKAIKWNHDRYAPHSKEFKIYITENGCDVPNESQLPLKEALQDDFRINYYSSYIKEMERAIGEGIDIRGYMAWSLLDNFEWADGYNYRFGLHYVDYTTPERTRYPKASSKWYADYAKMHNNYIVYHDGTVGGAAADSVYENDHTNGSDGYNDVNNYKKDINNDENNVKSSEKRPFYGSNNHASGSVPSTVVSKSNQDVQIEDFFPNIWNTDKQNIKSRINVRDEIREHNTNNDEVILSGVGSDSSSNWNLKAWFSSVWMKGWQLAQLPQFREQVFII